MLTHSNYFIKNRFVKILGSDIFWGGAMVIQLDYRLMPWTWNGLRSIIRESNRQGIKKKMKRRKKGVNKNVGVYTWFRLMPLIECLSSGHQGYSVPNIEPNILGRSDAANLFRDELTKLVHKYNLIFLQPIFTGTQLPILRSLIRNAPAYVFTLFIIIIFKIICFLILCLACTL